MGGTAFANLWTLVAPTDGVKASDAEGREAGAAGAAPEGALDLLGTRLGDAGRFELVAFAAAGGMGRVYRAHDHATGTVVAVKVLAPDGGNAARFSREAAVLQSIDHPGVVRYLDHGKTEDGRQYLAMEWLKGQDLSERLREGALPIADVRRIARGAAEALAAAHARGIVHRDLKPGNLFLCDGRSDRIKLLDFGIARSLATLDAATMTGTIVGTPAYMAPEQVRGDWVGASADVYGLGAVMFRCLTGRAPFDGPHPLAVLAKIVLEPPATLRELRTDVPPALEQLVLRMLSKDPAARPANGEALLEELSLASAGVEEGRRPTAAISAREQRVACIVLCMMADGAEQTVSTRRTAALHRAIELRGGVTTALAGGAWLVTVPGAASPVEQATRGVRSAQAIAAVRPDTPIFVGTGRVVVAGDTAMGEVIDRATEALVRAMRERAPGGVRVDVTTAELLEGRFRMPGQGGWRDLAHEEEALAPVRTLLGKPSPYVGREQVQGVVWSSLAAAMDEARACVALITAPPGLGKSRLLHETVATATAERQDLDVLFATTDPIRAGTPFGLAAQIVRRAAGILERDDAPARQRKLAALVEHGAGRDARRFGEMLGEICGVVATREDASPALRAARSDPSIMGDAIREAWIAWLDARSARAPVLLVIEDLHWADAPSVQLVEAALRALSERPLAVLATARPEAHALFPGAFRERGLIEVNLTPLSPRACERLVREALGASADEKLVKALARRAGGHPLYLEELVRASAAGCSEDALPDSILTTVQARLDSLGARPRRLLRAASVFGETFWSGGVAALLGEEVAPAEVDLLLAQLTQQEVLHVARAASGETAYRFRHALVRDAAYAMLAEPDRVLAHRGAAAWLEGVGETEPAILAEHYDRGAMPEQTLACLRRAAAHALEHNDLDRAMTHVARALTLAPGPADDAALRIIEAEVHYWRGDLAPAAERSSSAAHRLARGAVEWFEAVAVAIGALGQMGKNDEVAAWLDAATTADTNVEARGAHVVALCRGMTQLFWAHHPGDRGGVRACLDGLVARPEPLDAYQRGWVHRVRGESAWLHARDVHGGLHELEASCAAFEEAHAVRALCLTRLNAASLTGWSGATDRGLALALTARSEAERVGAAFLVRYAGAVEGLLRAYAGDGSARALMRSSLTEVSGTPRLAFVCHLVVAMQALDEGDLDVAEDSARAAVALPIVEELRAPALALLSRVHTARGRAEDALRVAREAWTAELACRDLDLAYGIVGLTLAEALEAAGEADAAHHALAHVFRELDAIARTIPAAERALFWARRLPNDRVLRLAAQRGMGPS